LGREPIRFLLEEKEEGKNYSPHGDIYGERDRAALDSGDGRGKPSGIYRKRKGKRGTAPPYRNMK